MKNGKKKVIFCDPTGNRDRFPYGTECGSIKRIYKHGYEVMKDRLGELYDYLEKEN